MFLFRVLQNVFQKRKDFAFTKGPKTFTAIVSSKKDARGMKTALRDVAI